MARERLSEVLHRLNARGEYATLIDIATTLRLPQRTYYELSDDLQQGLDFLYKAVIPYPPCPSCSSSDHVRFRYFNNSDKSRISLQPRFECYFRRPSALASPPPFDYHSASNSSSPPPTYPTTYQHPGESSELSVNSLPPAAELTKPPLLPAKRGRKPKAKRLLASDNGVADTPSWNTNKKPRLQKPETSTNCKGFSLSLNECQEHLNSHGGLQFLIQRALNIGEEIPLRRLRQKKNSRSDAVAMAMDVEPPAPTMAAYSSCTNIANPQRQLMNVAGNADVHVQSSGYSTGAVYPQQMLSNLPADFVSSASAAEWYNQCFRPLPDAAAATVMPFNRNYVTCRHLPPLAANPCLVSSANSTPILGSTRMIGTDQKMSGNVNPHVGYGQIPTSTCYGQTSENTHRSCHGPAYMSVNAQFSYDQMFGNHQVSYDQMSGNPQLAHDERLRNRHDQIMASNASPSTQLHQDQMSSNTQLGNDKVSGNTQLSNDQTSGNYRQLGYDQTTGTTQRGDAQISGNPQLAHDKHHDQIMSINTSTELQQDQMSGNTRTQLRQQDQLSGYDQMSGEPQLAERHDQTTDNTCTELYHGLISGNTQLCHGQISNNAQHNYGQVSGDKELRYGGNGIFRPLANHSIYNLSTDAVAGCSDPTMHMATYAYVNDAHPHVSDDGTLMYMSVVNGNAVHSHGHSDYPTVNYNHHDSLPPLKDVVVPDSVNYTETNVATSSEQNYNYDDRDDCLAAIMSELEGIIQSDKQDAPNDVDQLITNGTPLKDVVVPDSVNYTETNVATSSEQNYNYDDDCLAAIVSEIEGIIQSDKHDAPNDVDQLITNGTETTDLEELVDGVAMTAICMANISAAGASIDTAIATAGASAETDNAARASTDLETAMVAAGVSTEMHNFVGASTDTAMEADGASAVTDNAAGASTDTDNASATTTKAAGNSHLRGLQDQIRWIVSGKLPFGPRPTVGFPSGFPEDNLEGDGGFPDGYLFEHLWGDGFAVAS